MFHRKLEGFREFVERGVTQSTEILLEAWCPVGSVFLLLCFCCGEGGTLSSI